jgi:hypothetical protein
MSTKKSSCNPRELFMTGWGDAFQLHGDESLLGLGARLHPRGGASTFQGKRAAIGAHAPRGGYSPRECPWIVIPGTCAKGCGPGCSKGTNLIFDSAQACRAIGHQLEGVL